MSNILNAFLGLLSYDNLKAAANHLEESPQSIHKAGKEIAATFLGGVLEKGNDSETATILALASTQNSGIMSSLGDIFSGQMDHGFHKTGVDFVKHLFGNKTASLNNLISSTSDIKPSSVASLTSMLAPVFAGFLGNKMKMDGLNLQGLLNHISSEKSSLSSYLPKGLTNILNLKTLTAQDVDVDTVIGHVPEPVVSSVAGNHLQDGHNDISNIKDGQHKQSKWIAVIMIISLLLLSWYFIDSCNSCNRPGGLLAEAKNDSTQNKQAAVMPATREFVKVKLPSGLELNAYKGGIEEQVVEFLKSRAMDTMTAAALKQKWFNFDNINYVYGSTAALTKGSDIQLDNLVAILKEFKTAKIKLGAYTDKKGNDASNLKTSQARADDMRKRMTEKGVGAQITGAEGYGEQFATIDENASDEARAVDRKISLHFEK